VAVVINEFEIVAEPPVPAGERNREPQAVETGAPQELTTHDIATMMRHQAERSARYWAH
jgi:hypothetical protein